jgi:hypothetical protein
MEIFAKCQEMNKVWTRLISPPPGSLLTTIIHDDWWIDPMEVTRRIMQNDNYFFGSALQHHKHPDAKMYHGMSQRGKTRFRTEFEKRGRSKHPHMAKHAEVWKTYQALIIAASLGG